MTMEMEICETCKGKEHYFDCPKFKHKPGVLGLNHRSKQVMEKTKIALIREPGYPIGSPAPLSATCVCGARILNLDFKTDFQCQNCQQSYTREGWLKNQRGHIVPEIFLLLFVLLGVGTCTAYHAVKTDLIVNELIDRALRVSR